MKNDLKISQDTTVIRLVEERLKAKFPNKYKYFITLSDEEKYEYIKINMNILDVGMDKMLCNAVDKKIYPLLKNTINERINKEIVEKHIVRSNRAFHNLIEFRIIMQKYGNYIPSRTMEEESRLVLPYYLIIIESKYKSDIDLIIYLLVKNGIKYYRKNINGAKRYLKINSINKLIRESMYNKVTFLRENGYSIISDVCDRYLRNSIAHMDIIVFTNGSIAYQVNNSVSVITKSELDQKIVDVLSVSQCINESIRKYYDQTYGELPKNIVWNP